ncbi:MAG: VOC family protein [Myxococcales bacterium]|nr:VOC family protein [Myxococcales bacterium]
MKLGYVLLYVDDVAAAITFYERAFGLERAFVHESGQYGELATGATKLGFVHHETAGSHGFGYRKQTASSDPPANEVGLVTDDVEAAFKRAVDAGATPASEPKTKPWGQTVAYVRDPSGFLVELATPMGG